MSHSYYKVREFHNFRDLLVQSVTQYGHSPAFKVKNEIGQISNISYKHFKADVDALGTVLLELGLTDCKIAVAGANSYKWCTSYLTIGSGVGVTVPVDKELPFEDILNILETAEVSAIIFDKKFGEKLLENREKLPKKIVLISMDIKESLDGVISYDRLLDRGYVLLKEGDARFINRSVSGNKLTVLLFTSGTTGMSKAVMLSADNICSDVCSIMKIVKINYGERILSLLPLHHTYECTVTFLCCLYGGVTICFCDGLRYIQKNLQEYKPDILIVVPLILEKFYKKIEKSLEKEKTAKARIAVANAITKAVGALKFDATDYFFAPIKKAFGGNIRLIISGAAGTDPQIIKNMNRMGIQVFQGYGLTECSPIVICNSDKESKCASIGKPIPGVVAKIDKPDENEIGEICVKGPMVMLGYYKNEEATKAVFDYDGWFHTGDMGRVDDDGYYYICGRCKSVIVTHNGKNVYPEELEALLNKENCVKECMVVGDTDEKGNVIVLAKIFPDLKAISVANGNRNIDKKMISKAVSEAVKSVNSKVVSYKAIKRFEIMEKEFQKTTTSKIKRNQ